MEQYRYDFSVVMAVYNVENYIREAVESLIHQTIGFSHIQLIMVDDGSTDNSGKICDEYQKKYSENVLVIHKENGRQASARNYGLRYILGKYVNFMDADDTIAYNAMEKALEFMKNHEGMLDVCCIPIHYFGDDRGPHLLNDKFNKGSRVVDLMTEADCILMTVTSSFYTRDAVKKIVFDTELYIAEDAKVNLQVLMERPVLGLVTGTKYNYRKFGGSTMDKSHKVKLAYTQHLRYFSNWALDKAKEKFGFVPRFVQFTVMYELLWKFKRRSIPIGVLNQEEAEQYRKYLIETACRIDDDVILQQKYLEKSYKTYIFEKKYACKPEVKIENGDVTFTFGNTVAARASEIKAVWEFCKINMAEQSCIIEGHCHLFGLDPEDIRPYLIVNGNEIPCEYYERREMTQICLGEPLSYAQGFKVTFPLEGNELVIKAALKIYGQIITLSDYAYRHFFPVTGIYENAYANLDGYVLTVETGALKLSAKYTWLSRIVRECRLLKELWRKDLLGGRKAVGGRLCYHLLYRFKHKKLWLVSDRIIKADDNGESFFRYLVNNSPKNTCIIFCINENSDDYERMKRIGPCVNAMSFRHKMLHLLCNVNISSQADAVTVNPFFGHDDGLRDLLIHQKFVFLQHGITKDDISGWLNRYNKDISGFVTAAIPEKKSIITGNYYYSEEAVWLTGFPRFDRLYHKEEKKVTIMPTWRKYLMESVDAKTGIWKPLCGFEKSEFFSFYDKLLNSEHLLSVLTENGYTLQFFPHPNIQSYTEKFQHDPRVLFLPAQTSYREIYATSNLILTDYSSAVFDFVYLRKPVIYAQFDKDDFFEGAHVYTKGYFDYERDGFGEVTYDLKSTVDKIIEYVKSGCRLKDIYKERIDNFFAYNDKDNCNRVLEKILELQDRQ